jgi:signal peptidase I
MLSWLIEAVILLLIVIFIFRFIRRYTIIRVNGDSMLPTYKHGQIRVLDRLFMREQQPLVFDNPNILANRVYVILAPNEVFAIKRLIAIAQTVEGLHLWFEGDNKDNSNDSRNYGFLHLDNVIGEVVPLNRALKTLIKK